MRLILGSHTAAVLAESNTGETLCRVELPNPSFAALSGDRRFAYVASEDPDGPGMVHAFRVADDRLEPHGTPRPSGGDQPCHVAVHPAGRFLLAANYGDGSVAALPIDGDGALGDPSSVVAHSGGGPDPRRQSGPHAHQAIADPDGRWVLVCDLGTDEVVIYRLDETRGVLERHSSADFAPGQGVRHLAFSPDGDRVFAVAELSSEFVACEWDGRRGVLTPVKSIDAFAPGDEPSARNYPSATATSPDGRFVYFANRGHDSLAVVDAADFRLVGARPCGGRWPRDFCLTRDGRRLFAANEHSGDVVAFDVSGGRLAPGDAPKLELPGVTSVLEL
ncbi:MAG: lactonase family protein [Stackebrandtia sp.]